MHDLTLIIVECEIKNAQECREWQMTRSLNAPTYKTEQQILMAQQAVKS